MLPAGGMQAIAKQIYASLPEHSVHLNEGVASVMSDSIELESGRRVPCRAVVLATDASTSNKLSGSKDTSEWFGTTTVYYAAERSPVGEAILAINGEGSDDGPVNHLCVLSDVQPSYAPPGSALISVSLLGVSSATDDGVDADVRAQLVRWYGSQVRNWKRLRVDRIARALPCMSAQAQRAERIGDLFVCGDHVATPSIQGAMDSGRRVAEQVQAHLGSSLP